MSELTREQVEKYIEDGDAVEFLNHDVAQRQRIAQLEAEVARLKEELNGL